MRHSSYFISSSVTSLPKVSSSAIPPISAAVQSPLFWTCPATMDYTLPVGMNTGTVVVPGFIAFFCIIFWTFQRSKSTLFKVPKVGDPNQPYLQDVLLDASRRYPETPYMVYDTMYTKTLILPVRYLDEVKSLPESQLSAADAIEHRFEAKYSTISPRDPGTITSIKVDLTRNIGRTLEALQLEAEVAIPDCIGSCEDWMPIEVLPTMLHVVARLSGRIFVGLPLSRDKEWLDTTMNYTVAAFGSVEPVKKLFPLTRAWFAPLLPQVQQLREYTVRGQRLLAPILKGRLEHMKDPNFEPPVDMIQFMIQNSGELASDLAYQCSVQMRISMAAIHTTAQAITHMLFDLASHPECIAPLREELEAVLATDKGILVKSSLTKLKKMESFMKESQRMNPNSALSLTRLTTSSLTLSDGLYIPKGTYIAMCSTAIFRDPSIFESPETFKPFRFSDLRSLPENVNKHQFVTTGRESLAFGHGNHACPGRFFASNQIKIILARILLRYDIKFEESQGRPENMNGRIVIGPSTTGKVLFRKRDLY